MRGAAESVAEPLVEPPVRLLVSGDRQRFRFGVLVRSGLIYPHLTLLQLWALLVPFAIVAAWWCALLGGKVPQRLHRFLAAFVRYQTRVAAYGFLLADPFPGFTARTGYPVDLELARPRRHSRLRALAYLPLVLVVALLSIAAALALIVLTPFTWIICLIAGRIPRWMERTGVALLSVLAQSWAFAALVTDRLPARRRVLATVPWAPRPATTRPPRRAPLAGRGARLRAVLWFVLLVAGVVVAVHALWQTKVPGDLSLPNLDADRFFDMARFGDYVDQQDAADRWLLGGQLASLVALGVFARRGPRLARHSAAGPIGTGMFLGMLALAWGAIAATPFVVASVGVAPSDTADAALLITIGAPAAMASGALVIALAMGVARRFPRRWWLVTAPAVIALAAGFAWLAPVVDEGPRLEDPVLLADVRELAAREGIPNENIKFIDLRDETHTSPGNAFAVGGGTSAEIVLYGSLDEHREVRAMLAHEIGHIARRHTWKLIAWQALFLVLICLGVQLAIARRGDLYNPALIPLAVLVFSVGQLAWTPVQNAASRHYEAEADWMGLQATRDPRAVQVLMQELAVEHNAAPERPWWARAMFENHPDVMQRIAMSEAWEQRK